MNSFTPQTRRARSRRVATIRMSVVLVSGISASDIPGLWAYRQTGAIVGCRRGRMSARSVLERCRGNGACSANGALHERRCDQSISLIGDGNEGSALSASLAGSVSPSSIRSEMIIATTSRMWRSASARVVPRSQRHSFAAPGSRRARHRGGCCGSGHEVFLRGAGIRVKAPAQGLRRNSARAHYVPLFGDPSD